MTKHVRIPAPVPKILPSIIRSTGVRMLLLAAGCAALLVLGGGGYLLSHSDIPFVPHKPAVQAAPADSKVLGTATTKPSTQTPATGTPAPTTATAASQPAPNPNAQLSTRDTAAAATVCVGSCTGHQATVAPSFDLVVNTSKIAKQGLSLYIPFSVVRHGGLTAPITPGNISITACGTLTSLVTIQSEIMIGPDNGAIVLLPVHLGQCDINVHFSASAGSIIASTSFTYHL